jgi:hypothetical protein
MEMFGRVMPGRAITTPHVATRQAETKVNPGRPCLQAFFTPFRSGSNWFQSDHMFTTHDLAPEKGGTAHIVKILPIIVGVIVYAY